MISGPAINEQVFQRGSFAMSSEAQVNETAEAYQKGKFGFIQIEAGQRKVIAPLSLH